MMGASESSLGSRDACWLPFLAISSSVCRFNPFSRVSFLCSARGINATILPSVLWPLFGCLLKVRLLTQEDETPLDWSCRWPFLAFTCCFYYYKGIGSLLGMKDRCVSCFLSYSLLISFLIFVLTAREIICALDIIAVSASSQAKRGYALVYLYKTRQASHSITNSKPLCHHNRWTDSELYDEECQNSLRDTGGGFR